MGEKQERLVQGILIAAVEQPGNSSVESSERDNNRYSVSRTYISRGKTKLTQLFLRGEIGNNPVTLPEGLKEPVIVSIYREDGHEVEPREGLVLVTPLTRVSYGYWSDGNLEVRTFPSHQDILLEANGVRRARTFAVSRKALVALAISSTQTRLV